MEQILEILKGMPKSHLLLIVDELLREDKITYHELMELHVKHIEDLKKGATEKLMITRCEIIDLWCEKKKYRNDRLKEMIHKGIDEGWVNATHEAVDKK